MQIAKNMLGKCEELRANQDRKSCQERNSEVAQQHSGSLMQWGPTPTRRRSTLLLTWAAQDWWTVSPTFPCDIIRLQPRAIVSCRKLGDFSEQDDLMLLKMHSSPDGILQLPLHYLQNCQEDALLSGEGMLVASIEPGFSLIWMRGLPCQRRQASVIIRVRAGTSQSFSTF